MRFFTFSVLITALLFGIKVHPQTLSARPTHPISWQHMLPAGEMPGWNKSAWIEFEVMNGNHWAAPTTFTNLKTGRSLTFTADYEQTSVFVEFGKALSKKLAIAIEVPYAARHEGTTTDRIINGFHKLLNFDDFGRPLQPYGQSTLETSTDGVRRGPYNAPSGSGNTKLKLKYWPIQWIRSTGVAFGLHVKAPIEDPEKGMTSGSFDYTGMINLGIPMGDSSALYTTVAATYAEENWMFKDWPRNKWLWMFDLALDIGLTQKWAIVLDFAFYSPLMRKGDLEIDYQGTTNKEKTYEKIASGWNSMIEYRGQQMLGLKRMFGKDQSLMGYILEDWGPGDKDGNNDMVYSTGQPDFGFGLKFIKSF